MPEPTVAQILRGERPALTLPTVPMFEPGSQWAYSNIGYVIIQMMLEDMTGKALPRTAEEVLFGPLGMKSSESVLALTPGEALAQLQERIAFPGHVFFPDDVLLVGSKLLAPEKLQAHRHVSDAHLLTWRTG